LVTLGSSQRHRTHGRQPLFTPDVVLASMETISTS
jgi:hypothetical protein